MDIIKKYIYKIGQKLRNPSLKSEYDFLLKSDKWSKEQLVNYQIVKCKELLSFAYKYSFYYRNLFDNIGFDVTKFNSLSDLKKIPILEKQTLLEKGEEIKTNYPFKKLFFSETSGTSGQCLQFFRNEEWDSANRAAMFRGYNWYNVNPWDRNGYFWGYNIDKSQKFKTALLDFLQNRFRLFSYDSSHIKKFARKAKSATFISGYSSMIFETAKLINSLPKKQYHLKMIKGTSEKIYDSYQEEVGKAFGLKMISEYGSCESGIIAYECPNGNMHICMEHVIVEEINDEIVVTNLLSKSFPIIRYKLGDYIKLASPDFKCACGRQHTVILDVLGRVGSSIIGKRSKFPSLTFYYVFKNLASRKGIYLNYQAEQNKIGEVILRIEQNRPELLSLLQHELFKYFKKEILFEIKWGCKLHKMNGKLKDFISTI